MNVLLDTHILLWWLSDSQLLRSEPRQILANPNHDIYVSAVSLWEISIKRALGRLEVDSNTLLQAVEDSGFKPLPVTFPHALAAGALPRHHDDPFDRMLIAQALHENLSLLSHDKKFSLYTVSVIVC